MAKILADHDCPIIALDRFIQATRDSGYKGTASAISELIDNSLQAGARHIAVIFREVPGDDPIEVSIVDDGCGMDPFTLRQALQFGGSTRFGDRTGLGRYGMGLPNSSLSQAGRVTVYTWQTLEKSHGSRARQGRVQRQVVPEQVYRSYLDVDEIARGALRYVPVPRVDKSPPSECRGPSGTLVRWERCDRLDNRRISTLTRKLSAELGRRFRHFIWDGVEITINGTPIEPVDPLFLKPQSGDVRAELFGEEMSYEVMVNPSDPTQGTSHVHVRFSELPVHEWHGLSNDEKRQLGISKGAGVSIIRAGREVDYGWFFMGEKRRENYDDWWRCEIQFDPTLDEAFGITHTKQQIRPLSYLQDILTPDLEKLAHALNGRVRKAHLGLKARERFEEAEKLASKQDHLLEPLPESPDKRSRALLTDLKKQHPVLREPTEESTTTKYVIVEAPLRETVFFSHAHDGGRLVLVLNPDHPFYRKIYKPLTESDAPQQKELRTKLELVLLAAARSEAAAGQDGARLAEHRLEWSNILATFLTS